MTESRHTIRDPAVMRAMAHPARLAILEYLGDGNEATATECARVCGLSPSATSYHLRELAKAGLIEEAPSRGDGRERVWRRPRLTLAVDPHRDSPEAQQAATELVHLMLDQDDLLVRDWLARAGSESSEWANAAVFHRNRLLLTAEELTTLIRRIDELITPFTTRTRSDPPDGARRVSLLLRALPVTDAAEPEGLPDEV